MARCLGGNNYTQAGTRDASVVPRGGRWSSASFAGGQEYTEVLGKLAMVNLEMGRREVSTPAALLLIAALMLTACPVPDDGDTTPIDEAYVINLAGNSITVYGRTASGDTPLLRTLAGAATGLNAPESIIRLP